MRSNANLFNLSILSIHALIFILLTVFWRKQKLLNLFFALQKNVLNTIMSREVLTLQDLAAISNIVGQNS